MVALLPGLNPSRWALILAGTSTIGTQGAVEYVCREDTVQELLRHVSPKKAGRMPLFEAIIAVQIKGGVPVHSNVVVFHPSSQASERVTPRNFVFAPVTYAFNCLPDPSWSTDCIPTSFTL